MKKTTIIAIGIAILLAATGLILGLNGISIGSAGDFTLGYFSAGNFSIGVFSSGIFSVGIFSIGIFSIGIFSVGIFNIGLVALGFFILGWKKRYARLHSTDEKQELKTDRN